MAATDIARQQRRPENGSAAHASPLPGPSSPEETASRLHSPCVTGRGDSLLAPRSVPQTHVCLRLRAGLIAFAALGLSLFPGGCVNGPQKGGRASLPYAAPPLPGNKIPTPAEVKSMDIQQPDNPAQPASQSREATNEIAFVIPAGSTVRQVSQSASADKTNTTTMEFVVAAPTPFKQLSGERNQQIIGAAQQDTSRELAAKFSAIRPVQLVGVLIILAGGVLAYFGWWTKAAICGVVGIGMIVVASVIPGNELLILTVGGTVLIIGCLVVMYAYSKGALDKYLPDELDRKPAGETQPTTSKPTRDQ